MVDAVLGECIWDLSFNERRMAIELELTKYLEEEEIDILQPVSCSGRLWRCRLEGNKHSRHTLAAGIESVKEQYSLFFLHIGLQRYSKKRRKMPLYALFGLFLTFGYSYTLRISPWRLQRLWRPRRIYFPTQNLLSDAEVTICKYKWLIINVNAFILTVRAFYYSSRSHLSNSAFHSRA